MGEIILNGKSYNSGMKYKEVTQAEYNALPSSKLTDGTLYCITDAPGPGEGFPPMIYSYEEREIGVWIDGKPLYQKTIYHNQSIPANTNNYRIICGLSNVDKIVKIDIVGKDGTNFYNLPLHVYTNHYEAPEYSVNVQAYYISSDEIRIDTGSSRGLDGGVAFTFQYTKTTDTPGSGTWTTNGTYAKHYSTEEKVIGTWIDGKTLYEKTITVLSSSISGSENAIAHGISNVDNIFFVEGCMMRSGNLSLPLVTYHTASSWACSIYNLTRTNFILYLGSDEQSRVQTIYITLRYTKTTD